MAVKPILLMGNPTLYQRSAEINFRKEGLLGTLLGDLRDTLRNFRVTHGFGRAIAAVQIGVKKRVIYIENAGKEYALINPVLDFPTGAQIELWDDCFSLPNLRVKVKRYTQVEVTYQDTSGANLRETFHGDLAELVQHEYDHLEGVLMVNRAMGPDAFAFQSEMHFYE